MAEKTERETEQKPFKSHNNELAIAGNRWSHNMKKHDRVKEYKHTEYRFERINIISHS